MHHKGSRGMGSDINRRVHRDIDGKVLFPDGMATTIKDPPYKVQPKEDGRI
ncbi:hypothetical protein UNSWDHB_265 [Dehalobacter sp. UNSWDHB]|nr:hypothetical protein UNSWDHB_265 [Dehalobacter sp. UNSWDHB]